MQQSQWPWRVWATVCWSLDEEVSHPRESISTWGKSMQSMETVPARLCNLPCTSMYYAAAAAKLLQSCLTLCDPIDGNPPGSTVPGTLQAKTLEWVAISFSSTWKWKVKVKSFSRVWLFATAQTAAHQAPPSMRFSRQECWSGLPLPSPNLQNKSHPLLG